MRILKKYLGFVTYKKDENFVLYCKDKSGRDWYDIQKEDKLSDFIGKQCIMVEDNRVISVSNDPARMYPSDSDLYILHNEFEQLYIGDYVKVSNLNITKSTWEECVSSEEKIQFYKGQMLGINKKLTELDSIGLTGDSEYVAMQKQLEEYRKKYMDSCHELALSMSK